MSTVLISVSAEPVSLAEAKLHLRVDGTDEDALITALITAAREMAEQQCGRSFATATWELKLDAFPAGEIRLDWGPVTAVSSVQYIDTAEATQTLSASAYSLDSHNTPAWLLPAYGAEWPDTLDCANAVTVRYTAGTAGDCPESVNQWILLQVGHWHRNREAATDKPLVALPYADGLLDRYRVY